MQISEIDRRVLGIEKKTLDDIRKEMIAHKQDEERQAVKQLRAVEAEERQTRIELSEATGAYVKQSLKTRLSALATTISSYKKDIANYRATLAYFESIIPQVSVFFFYFFSSPRKLMPTALCYRISGVALGRGAVCDLLRDHHTAHHHPVREHNA
jgi:hypothetical protein